MVNIYIIFSRIWRTELELNKYFDKKEIDYEDYCIGRNYTKHVRELGNSIPKVPLFFLA